VGSIGYFRSEWSMMFIDIQSCLVEVCVCGSWRVVKVGVGSKYMSLATLYFIYKGMDQYKL